MIEWLNDCYYFWTMIVGTMIVWTMIVWTMIEWLNDCYDCYESGGETHIIYNFTRQN